MNNQTYKKIICTPINELIIEYPYIEDFFISIGIKKFKVSQTIPEFIDSIREDFVEDCGMDRAQILGQFQAFIDKMGELKLTNGFLLKEITILGGIDKSGKPEAASLTMKTGEIICIVGPTGSGKSRLLADIECLSQKDTPTGRQILLNGEIPDNDKRFSIEHKLVAQLSQNMNFIMDITVEEFISMHAESRMVPDIREITGTIAECANELAGEKFDLDTPVTALSGGQSRALMIADTALLSTSPIVLIDEIENAGVDRRKALDLLVKKEKIVLMSTHDPILALMGDKRISIKNGGINNIIQTSKVEKNNLLVLQRFDSKLSELRNKLRQGEKIDFDTKKFLED